MRDLYIVPIHFFVSFFGSFPEKKFLTRTAQSDIQKIYGTLVLQTPSRTLLAAFRSFTAPKSIWPLYFILMFAWLNSENVCSAAPIEISSTSPLNLKLNTVSFVNVQPGQGSPYLKEDGIIVTSSAPRIFLNALPNSEISGVSPSGRPYIATGQLRSVSGNAIGPKYWLTLANVNATMVGTIQFEGYGTLPIQGNINYTPKNFDSVADSKIVSPGTFETYFYGQSSFRPSYNQSLPSPGLNSFISAFARIDVSKVSNGSKLTWASGTSLTLTLDPSIFIETLDPVPAGTWTTEHKVLAEAGYANGPPYKEILDKVQFKVAYPSCTLFIGNPNVKMTIAANNDSSAAETVSWEVGCDRAGALDNALKITASGGSNATAANKLSIIDSSLIKGAELWVEGSWSDTPKCNSIQTLQTILFNGSPSLPIKLEQANTVKAKGVLSFVACKKGAVPAGDYKAKATIELVNQ